MEATTTTNPKKRERNQNLEESQIDAAQIGQRKIIKAKRIINKDQDADKEKNNEDSDLEFECSEEEILEDENVI